jgi:hypothetical protein
MVDSATSIDTQTPQLSPVEDMNTVTTVLPTPPVNIEVVPNPDIQNISNIDTIYLSKIQEISQLYQKEL